MAYSIAWSSKVITIPKADTVLVSSSPDVRSLDVTTLWQTLIDIQDGEEGIPYLDIVKNTPPLTVAGVTLARVVEIINGYTITFENLQYAVNIIGGNSNLADKVNKNQVSVNTGNSAGFVSVTSGSGLSAEQATQLANVDTLITARLDALISSRALPGAGLSSEQATRLRDIFLVHGLDPIKPLTTRSTARKIPADGSEINQTVSEVDGVVTVTRQ